MIDSLCFDCGDKNIKRQFFPFQFGVYDDMRYDRKHIVRNDATPPLQIKG